MIIEHHDRLTDVRKLGDIWTLLCRYDHSFIPPLSARVNTSQPHLLGNALIKDKPSKYFEQLKQQSFLVALQQDRIVGFMSYRSPYVCQELKDDIETTYITTIIVEEEQRGKGITTTFYKEILNHLKHTESLTTRTWSTNNDHVRILEKIGFDQVKRIGNDRGQEIDTIYYRKIVKGESN